MRTLKKAIDDANNLFVKTMGDKFRLDKIYCEVYDPKTRTLTHINLRMYLFSLYVWGNKKDNKNKIVKLIYKVSKNVEYSIGYFSCRRELFNVECSLKSELININNNNKLFKKKFTYNLN